MGGVIFILLLFLLAGCIPAAIASGKGRGFIEWMIYGAFLFPIALIHSLLLQPTEAAKERSLIAQGMVKCPSCAEIIKSDARVCRYCGKSVE